MNRDAIIKELSKFFNVSELVCDHTYAKWGEKSWQFLDTNVLHVLLVIRRDIIKKPLYCNTKQAHQKGLRCNMCQLVKEKKVSYLSSHILGKAFDLICSTMKAEDMRKAIIAHQDLLPCPIRMEDGVSWLHIDVLPQSGVTDKVYLFKA